MKLFEENTQGPRQFIESLIEQVRLSYEEMETLIAEKVAEAVDRLGLPTNRQIQDLSDRVDSLARKVEAFSNARRKRTSREETREG